MVPLSALIVSVTSGKAEVDHAIRNKLPAESIMTRDQPNTEALLPSLLYYSVFLIILYFANDFFFKCKNKKFNFKFIIFKDDICRKKRYINGSKKTNPI